MPTREGGWTQTFAKTHLETEAGCRILEALDQINRHPKYRCHHDPADAATTSCRRLASVVTSAISAVRPDFLEQYVDLCLPGVIV
jgi:hypothetical protein